MGKRLPLLNDESAQDVEILRGQTDFLTANLHDPSLEIDTQFRSFDLRERLRRRSDRRRVDTRLGTKRRFLLLLGAFRADANSSNNTSVKSKGE